MNLSRRSFLQKTGIVSAVSVTLPSAISLAAIKIHDGKKLNIALCGLGRYASYLALGLE
jgi:hypothetical protein